MSRNPIQFVNRYTGCVETESVYGERFLRWTYEGALGRLALHLLIKRALFSRWYGTQMKRRRSAAKIAGFIERYGINKGDLLQDPRDFGSFNDFFIRRLKPGARPICEHPGVATFPADARHLGFQDLSCVQGIFVKGQQFDLELLLMDAELAKRVREGTLVLSRLCPVDYHRFHFPCDGTPTHPRSIKGPLYSVNPFALRRHVEYLWTNKRMLTSLMTEEFGQVLLLEIGATCVGSIQQTFEPGRFAAKGAEKGYFEFGGSSTVTIFEKGRIRLSDDLLEATARGLELYAKMGDRMGSVRS